MNSLGEVIALGTTLMAVAIGVGAFRAWYAWHRGEGPRPWPAGGSDGGGDASDGGSGD